MPWKQKEFHGKSIRKADGSNELIKASEQACQFLNDNNLTPAQIKVCDRDRGRMARGITTVFWYEDE